MLEDNTGMRLFQSEEGSNLHGFVSVFVFLNTDIFFSLKIRMFYHLYDVLLETIFYISFISHSASGGTGGQKDYTFFKVRK